MKTIRIKKPKHRGKPTQMSKQAWADLQEHQAHYQRQDALKQQRREARELG